LYTLDKALRGRWYTSCRKEIAEISFSHVLINTGMATRQNNGSELWHSVTSSPV